MRTSLPARDVPTSRDGDLSSPVRVYVWSRALTLLIAVVAGARAGVGALTFLNRWDAPLFLAIARYGYASDVPGVPPDQVDGLRAFFPLYPVLVRATAWLFGVPLVLAAVALSLAAGAAAVALVVRIGREVTGEESARRAAALFSFFPGAMVLSMPYSEGVMIVLAAATLLALLQERWGLAGFTAALATASRASALALLPACLWAAVQAYRRGAGWRPFIAPALTPLGMATYFAFLWALSGDPLAYLTAEDAWGSGLAVAGAPVWHLTAHFLRAPLASPLAATGTLAVMAAVGGVIVLLRRGWPPILTIYSVSILAVSALCRVDGLRPRDVLTAFPLFLAVAHVLKGPAYRAVLALLATGLGFSFLFHNLGPWHQP